MNQLQLFHFRRTICPSQQFPGGRSSFLGGQICFLLRCRVFHTEASENTRDSRVTDNEAQGTMGKRKVRVEATSRPFSPSRLPLRANFHRGRDVWVRGRGHTVFLLRKKQLSQYSDSRKKTVSYAEVRLFPRRKFKKN